MEAAGLGIGKGKIGQRHAAGIEIHPSPESGGHSLGLLHDFLQHEVAVAAPVHQGILGGNGA